MSWVGWTVTGSAIAMAALIAAGLVIAVVRGILLKRRVSATSRTVSPLVDGISAGLSDIERGVARARARRRAHRQLLQRVLGAAEHLAGRPAGDRRVDGGVRRLVFRSLY